MTEHAVRSVLLQYGIAFCFELLLYLSDADGWNIKVGFYMYIK